MNQDPFKEYIRESEPDKRDKGYAWHTAIGLQAVDGLKTSEYLVHTAVRNIEGEISFEEANALLYDYYEENPARNAADRTEEADKVSVRIAELLSEKAFSFTPNHFLFTRSCLTASILMQGVSGITISRRKSGCLMEQLYSMAVPQS